MLCNANDRRSSKRLKEISRAIEIRDKLQKKGWRYYEFRRARCRIRLDENFKNKVASDPQAVKEILGDLRVAYGDTERWQGWYETELEVTKWLELNKINVKALG